ncbi:MAG: lipopolysaccharide heptosyltransferase II, partial [Candidatus Omnitrophica bacterium]|nr:lipopolysaccharide heptosyltransferase II [Candidatus Omnitrophota bacterium]
AFIAGIPVRVGYSHRKRDFLMTKLVAPPSIKEHRIQSYIRVAEAIGAKSSGTGISLQLDALSDEGYKLLAQRHQLSAGEYTVFHPGANWDLKRWPAACYAELAHSLVRNGKQIVFCGSDRDRDLAEEIIRIAGIRAVNVCGETSLEDLMQLIGNASLLVSNDSGPLHLAAGLDVPFIGIYGPTSPDATSPPESARSKLFHNRIGCEIPCYFNTCPDRECLRSVLPSEVTSAALELAR